jgi:hypothetical protein
MGLAASEDHLHFTAVFAQPLMLAEPGDWSRKNGLELLSYPVLIDAKTGLNQLGDRWLLAYMYLNPGRPGYQRAKARFGLFSTNPAGTAGRLTSVVCRKSRSPLRI